MRTIFYYDMHARHDVIIESACVWLEDVNSIPKNFFCGNLIFKISAAVLEAHNLNVIIELYSM